MRGGLEDKAAAMVEDKGEQRTRAARLPRMAGTCPGVGRRRDDACGAARRAEQREEEMERLTDGPARKKIVSLFFF